MTPMRRVKMLFFRLGQQYHRCFYCSCDLTDPSIDITLDHVIPKSVGWIKNYDEPQNVVACCLACNNAKGDSMPSDNDLHRLDNLNKEYSDEAACTAYQSALRFPVHLMAVFNLSNVHN